MLGVTCVADPCDDGLFMFEGNCIDCMLNCKMCTDVTSCLTCSDGYTWI